MNSTGRPIIGVGIRKISDGDRDADSDTAYVKFKFRILPIMANGIVAAGVKMECKVHT